MAENCICYGGYVIPACSIHGRACRVYWNTHGCKLERGHDGPHLCSCADDPGINPETREYENEPGVFNVGAPPYYGPDTRFFGEDYDQLQSGEKA